MREKTKIDLEFMKLKRIKEDKKMSEFKVKFRGVRGSFPVADKNFLKFG